MSDWRPIETAPKDGSAILAWTTAGYQVLHWAGDDWFNGDVLMGGMGIDVTHWMPLPEPPDA